MAPVMNVPPMEQDTGWWRREVLDWQLEAKGSQLQVQAAAAPASEISWIDAGWRCHGLHWHAVVSLWWTGFSKSSHSHCGAVLLSVDAGVLAA